MQAITVTNSGFTNLATASATRCMQLCLLGLGLGLVLVLFLPVQDVLAEPGFINRAPVTKAVTEKSGLDKLAESLSDVAKSMDKIVAEPDVIKTEEEMLIAKPVENISPSNQPNAKSIPTHVKPVKIKAPVATPVLATQATSKPAPVKVSDKTMAKEHTKKIMAEQKNPDTVVKTPQNKIVNPTYIKLSIQGNELKEDAEQWSCVVDTRNGLVWEVKDNNGGLRDKKHSYSWFDPSHEKLKGIADGGRCKGGIQCDTNAYVQALNAQNFCGHSDWRLPTREEIQQLVDMGNDKTEAKINQNLFPGTEPSWYWTSSSNENNPGYAWYVLFRNGVSLNDLKERPKHIRLVRKDKKA